MMNPLTGLPLTATFFCKEIVDKKILVIGKHFIKIFSLKTLQEISSIVTEDENRNFLLIPENGIFSIMTEKTLLTFSLKDFTVLQKERFLIPRQYYYHFRTTQRIIFREDSKVFSLELNTLARIELDHRYFNNLVGMDTTSCEKNAFLIGSDRTLRKWEPNFRGVMISVSLESTGRSLLVKENTGTVFVGMKNGALSEFSLHNISLIRTLRLHTNSIQRVIKSSFGEVMTCSKDGFVSFPYRNSAPIKFSDKEIYSISELSDKRIACCCDDGLKIKTLSFCDNSSFTTMSSIISSLNSIINSSSSQKSQLISLLQHHLIQLVAQVEHQPEKFSGLSLSLLPDLKSIQRSHYFEGSPHGKTRVLTQKYVLEMMSSKSVTSDSLATFTLFNRKFKVFGRITDAKNPMNNFQLEKVIKGKWLFSMQNQIFSLNSIIYGLVTVHFLNGYVNCYILDGEIINKSEFQNTIKVDGIVKKVSAIGDDGLIVTSDRRLYCVNFETNMVEDCFKY